MTNNEKLLFSQLKRLYLIYGESFPDLFDVDNDLHPVIKDDLYTTESYWKINNIPVTKYGIDENLFTPHFFELLDESDEMDSL